MYKLKFDLIPDNGVVKPYIEPYGYIFRALLMTWLKDIEPRLVHELHSYNSIRPYSIQVSYRRQTLVFYLNIFNNSLATPIINDLINKSNKSFTLSTQKFKVKKVVFEDFSLSLLLKRAKKVKQFKIEFVEPTYFNTTRGSNVIRLPIPELLFSNLANLWNDLYDGPEKIEKDEFLEWVNQNVFPSSLDIKTKAKEMGENVPAVGIVGWVNFTVENADSNYARTIDFLSQLGELANVGGGRTAAFGVIKYIPIGFFQSQKNRTTKSFKNKNGHQ